MKKVYLIILPLILLSITASSQVKINEVYGGGGNAGSVWKNDFIELYNNSASPVSLAGWSVQYASAAGTTWQVTNLSGSIPANGYYLIQEAVGAGGTTSLPTPDATGAIAMSATAGKIILCNTTTAQSGANPPTGGVVIDKAGYGTTATGFEGGGPTPAPSNTSSVQRISPGFDTDNNNTDFGVVTPPTPTNTVVLPVTLLSFNAIKQGSIAKITWTTSQEINAKEFIVERSVNGINWQAIAIAPAAGNSNSTTNYSISDASPAKGINFYRLKSVDIDNKFVHSPVRRVNFGNKYTYSIYPNPATDILQLTVDNAAGFNANVQIVNSQGQVMISRQINSNNQPAQINISFLSSGIYILKIITADGSVSMLKFTKQ
jgi:hypothetical protein